MIAIATTSDESLTTTSDAFFNHLAAPDFMSQLFHAVLEKTGSIEEAREAIRVAATVVSQLTDESADTLLQEAL